ncbi:MAG: hypothetical protein PHI13_16235, partial [Methylococcales bacterium]|nr:hypothetical protein [Methylococcales bacterium]
LRAYNVFLLSSGGVDMVYTWLLIKVGFGDSRKIAAGCLLCPKAKPKIAEYPFPACSWMR